MREGGVRMNMKKILDETVETALRSAALWDEVNDRLNSPAFGLSGSK
jgi:phosphate transport system ATP-binding protein